VKISNGRMVKVIRNGEHGVSIGTIGKALSKHIIGNQIYFRLSIEGYPEIVNSECLRAI